MPHVVHALSPDVLKSPGSGKPRLIRTSSMAGGVPRGSPEPPGASETRPQEAAAADPAGVVVPAFEGESEDFDPEESDELEPPLSEAAEALVSDFSALSLFSGLSDLSDFLAEVRLSVL